MKNISLPGTGFAFAFDKDAAYKAIAIVVSAAATAAFTAGLQALTDFLSTDPKYAVYATLITAIVSAFSRKKGL